MKMPEIIEEIMFAPCGMNCAGCLKTEALCPRIAETAK